MVATKLVPYFRSKLIDNGSVGGLSMFLDIGGVPVPKQVDLVNVSGVKG